MSANIDSRSVRYHRNTSEKYSFLFFDGRRISERIGGVVGKRGGTEEGERGGGTVELTYDTRCIN